MTGMTVLIADDDAGVLDLLEETLAREGMRVLRASNGREAVAAAEGQTVHVALLDWKMPEMDGLEALKAIKGRDPNVGVILMTAHADMEGLDLILGHGALDCVIKPFHRQEILRVLRNAAQRREFLAENHRLRRELQERVSDLQVEFEERTRQLRESQIKYKQIVDNTSDMILVVSGGRVRFANPRVAEVTGYGMEEILGLPLASMMGGEEAGDDMGQGGGGCRPADGTTLFSMARKDGGALWAEATEMPSTWDGLPATVMVVRDVTRRREAEAALARSKEQLQEIMETAPVIIANADLEGRITFVNRKFEEVTGYTRGELLGRYWTEGEIFPAESVELLLQRTRDKIKGQPPTPAEVRFRSKSGAWGWASGIGSLIRDRGHAVGIQVFAEDITERKRAEEASRQSEHLYRTLAENSLTGIYMFDQERYRFANETFCRLSGYSWPELARMEPLALIAPDCREEIRERVRKRLSGEGVVSDYETRMLRKDGVIRDVHVKATTIRFDENLVVVGNIVDITERKGMEEEILKARKLESVGLLAGGIAHDFNNILAAVLGNVSLAKFEVRPGERIYEFLAEAEQAVSRARQLTQQLLTFSSGGAPIKKPTSMAQLIRESCAFALSGSKSRCEVDLPEGLWDAEADEGQISRVIHNLVINADQAMPDGGIVEVRAQNVNLQEGDPLPLPAGPYLQVSVADQGIGIPQEHLSRIFDPYFTTKQKGSGLGLATAYSIVSRHGGHLAVSSRIGSGSVFRILLPASARKDDEPAAQGARAVTRAQGRVLVMEDEESVLRMAGEMLTHLGYEPSFARDGAEALAAYQAARQSGRPFDAVIMDLTIPGGMGGRETLARLRALDPSVRAVVSSGYSTDPVMADAKAFGFGGVLAKPYRLQDLHDVLRGLLREG
jgi:PAS domain S-box-containing protein